MTYANPEALVETDWLADHLGDDGIAIIEVDEDTSAYALNHIPGAVSLNWKTELAAAPRRDFVDGSALASLLASKGVSNSQRIILYGGNNNWFAAYAYWLFRYRGFDNVSLLNGGRMKWELEGKATTTMTSVLTPGTFTSNGDHPELRAFRDDVVARAEAGTGALVDVRSPAEFSGETLAPPHLPTEQPYVPGHVPGASNIPWSKAAKEDGSFKTTEELTRIYEEAGINPDQKVITYCRIGERSSHTWFVLTQLLGFPNVANYDGSWTEYGSLVNVPVALGPAT
ncbi:MAG: sulfurtransferase [Actinomycetota bacterium]|nr:sulfurtransferase [Actinomycetota bacterium]